MDDRTRKILEAESDPRILRGLIASMADYIKKQDATIARIESENAKKAQSGFALEEQVKLLRRSLFGKKSEIRDASDRPRDKSQEAALIFSQATFPAAEARSGKFQDRCRMNFSKIC